MAAYFCDEGEHDILDVYFGSGAHTGTFYVGLFKNASGLGESSVLTDLVEPSGGGYARQSVPNADWTITGPEAEATQETFSASSDWGNIYGYFVATTSDNGGKLLALEEFSDGPYNVLNGGSVKVTAKITAS